VLLPAAAAAARLQANGAADASDHIAQASQFAAASAVGPLGRMLRFALALAPRANQHARPIGGLELTASDLSVLQPPA
jgi:hypothetical protein